MDDNKGENRDLKGASDRRRGRGIGSWIWIIFVAVAVLWLLNLNQEMRSEISISFLRNQLEGKDEQGVQLKDSNGKPIITNILELKAGQNEFLGEFIVPPDEPLDPKSTSTTNKTRQKLNKKFRCYFVSHESEDYKEIYRLATDSSRKIDYSALPESNVSTYVSIGLALLMVGVILFVYFQIRRQQNQMMNGGGFLSGFSRSTAKRYEESEQKTTFADVAGIEGVKADLMEIVDYLREPDKFRRLGGRVPKGVLLFGPPGTGKTLLARAVAGEANAPFYSVNGSEFIQMFVGVGASRVRDLFGTAKENGPSIIFIDEIDAVGRQRGAGLGGGHDEREQTLNQILSEMDGFAPSDSVIVIAATNRPDVLDPALLRPGRFDRHITVSRPTQKGRLEILKVHVRNVPLGEDVDLEIVAGGTIGLTGADLRNIVNEAALWAARQNKTKVNMSDFEYARDKVLMGAKREEVLSVEEKEKTAYHEAGHTIAAWFLPGSYPVHKVTIVPRGRALGVTQMMPGEEKMNLSESELRDHLVVLLAGRAAEKIIYNEVTVGAESDLERATSMTRRMVMNWGMSEKLGPVCYKVTDEDPFLGREMHQQRQFSEHTMEVIDEEVVQILRDAASRAEAMLIEKKDLLISLEKALLSQEELDSSKIAEVLGPSIHSLKKAGSTNDSASNKVVTSESA